MCVKACWVVCESLSQCWLDERLTRMVRSDIYVCIDQLRRQGVARLSQLAVDDPALALRPPPDEADQVLREGQVTGCPAVFKVTCEAAVLTATVWGLWSFDDSHLKYSVVCTVKDELLAADQEPQVGAIERLLQEDQVSLVKPQALSNGLLHSGCCCGCHCDDGDCRECPAQPPQLQICWPALEPMSVLRTRLQTGSRQMKGRSMVT